MLYWGDYVAIGLLLFTLGFIIGWTTCSLKEWEEKVEEKKLREIEEIFKRYEENQKSHKKKQYPNREKPKYPF